jgi:hypothetical protein
LDARAPDLRRQRDDSRPCRGASARQRRRRMAARRRPPFQAVAAAFRERRRRPSAPAPAPVHAMAVVQRCSYRPPDDPQTALPKSPVRYTVRHGSPPNRSSDDWTAPCLGRERPAG